MHVLLLLTICSKILVRTICASWHDPELYIPTEAVPYCSVDFWRLSTMLVACALPAAYAYVPLQPCNHTQSQQQQAQNRSSALVFVMVGPATAILSQM